jgi:hypothetical protein
MEGLSEIQTQIQATIGELETLKKINSHLTEINSQLQMSYSKIEIMDAQLDKELRDIDELEKIGVKALFYKTLGSQEQQLEKERQDYLELSLKYKQFKAEVELMEYERELLKKKSVKLPQIQNKLIQLKDLRQKEILDGPDLQLREDYLTVLDKLDLNVAISKEIDEALDTGQESIRAVESIISALNKASDWGDWTPERKAKYAKQRAMDDAIKLLPIARHRLNLFVKEMADLGENDIQIKLNPIQFNSFTDFFFDNLISDWIVQKKIVSTRNDLMRTLSYIKRLVMTLNREAQLIQKEQISLQHQKENILLK